MNPEGNKSNEKIYESDYLITYINIEQNYLYADWSGNLNSSMVKEGYLALLADLERYPLEKVLNNNTKVLRQDFGAIDWVGRVWFPKVHDISVRWLAWVYSPEVYTRISIDVVVNLNPRVVVETFYQVPDAQAWLMSRK